MKSSRNVIAISLVCSALAGCAGTMLPGRMYSAQTGNISQFQIETSRGNGKMEAFDPKTGERFTGEYSGFYRGQSAVYGSVGGSSVSLYSPPTGANASGILVGNKGRTIRLYFEIKPGIRPTGVGTGVDQHGSRYEIYF